MAFCGKCGAQLHENATFCAACGTPAGQPGEPSSVPAPVVIPTVSAARVPASRGFFGSLFDLSFTNFVTTKIIKFLFVLAIILAALVAIGMIAFSNNPYSNVPPALVIILAPIVFFVYVLLARVWLEIIMVTFRMAEHLAEIAQQGRK